jgi:hypothetical protein
MNEPEHRPIFTIRAHYSPSLCPHFDFQIFGIAVLFYGALDTLFDRMQRVQTFTLLTWPDDSMTLTF